MDRTRGGTDGFFDRTAADGGRHLGEVSSPPAFAPANGSIFDHEDDDHGCLDTSYDQDIGDGDLSDPYDRNNAYHDLYDPYDQYTGGQRTTLSGGGLGYEAFRGYASAG